MVLLFKDTPSPEGRCKWDLTVCNLISRDVFKPLSISLLNPCPWSHCSHPLCSVEAGTGSKTMEGQVHNGLQRPRLALLLLNYQPSKTHENSHPLHVKSNLLLHTFKTGKKPCFKKRGVR